MANTETHAPDLGDHRTSYLKFLGWLKLGSILTAIVTAFVIFLISR